MPLNLQMLIINGFLDELAGCVNNEADAAILLGAIKFPAAHRPNFERSASSMDFWLKVCEQIESGRILGGFEALLQAAAKRFPGNPVFARYRHINEPQKENNGSASSHDASATEFEAGTVVSGTKEGDNKEFKLKVFLCHSSSDKPEVRKLYERLSADDFEPWLDEKKILPGQYWDFEIKKSVKEADVIIVCLSEESVEKIGYVQKEITYALDLADMRPEGTIFIIPIKLQECTVPTRLQRWQWVNFYEDWEKGYNLLKRALLKRAGEIERKRK